MRQGVTLGLGCGGGGGELEEEVFYTIEGTRRHRLEYSRSYRRTSREEKEGGGAAFPSPHPRFLLPGPRAAQIFLGTFSPQRCDQLCVV